MNRKPIAEYMWPLQPDAALARIVGSNPLSCIELTRKLWAYIKKNGLQDKKNRRQINTDANLQCLFGGKRKVNMFEMTKLVSKHISNAPYRPTLARIVGKTLLTKKELRSEVRAYISRKGLRDKAERNLINADANLRRILGGREKIKVSELDRLIDHHIYELPLLSPEMGKPERRNSLLVYKALTVTHPRVRKRVRDKAKSPSKRTVFEKSPFGFDEDAYKKSDAPQKTERQSVGLDRVEQDLFRKRVLSLWKGRCAVTGVRILKMLCTGHIKPWRVSSRKEKVDAFNGLPLIPNLDKAFENGLISFDSNGRVLVSVRLPRKDAEGLGINRELKLRDVPFKTRKYLGYHAKISSRGEVTSMPCSRSRKRERVDLSRGAAFVFSFATLLTACLLSDIPTA